MTRPIRREASRQSPLSLDAVERAERIADQYADSSGELAELQHLLALELDTVRLDEREQCARRIEYVRDATGSRLVPAARAALNEASCSCRLGWSRASAEGGRYERPLAAPESKQHAMHAPGGAIGRR